MLAPCVSERRSHVEDVRLRGNAPAASSIPRTNQGPPSPTHMPPSGRCLLNGRGAIGCILMFFLGEVTSPVFNTFTISK